MLRKLPSIFQHSWLSIPGPHLTRTFRSQLLPTNLDECGLQNRLPLGVYFFTIGAALTHLSAQESLRNWLVQGKQGVSRRVQQVLEWLAEGRKRSKQIYLFVEHNIDRPLEIWGTFKRAFRTGQDAGIINSCLFCSRSSSSARLCGGFLLAFLEVQAIAGKFFLYYVICALWF